MSKSELPRFIQLSSALQEFVTVEGTQAQQHIRPLHQYLTVRLVLEGGFDPGEITPHPPLRVESKGQRKLLSFAPGKEDNREQTWIGWGANQVSNGRVTERLLDNSSAFQRRERIGTKAGSRRDG